MGEIISIGLQLETQALQNGARQAVTTLRDLEQASARVTQSTRALQASGAQAATGLRATGTGATTAARALDPFVINSAKATQELGHLQRASQQTGRVFDDLSRQVTAVVASYVSFQAMATGVRAVIESSLKLEALSAAFTGITGSSKASGEALDFVRQQAQRLGVDFVALADAYKTIAAASRGTTLEGQKARDIFLAVAEASRVLQLSTHQMGGALTAVSQMISKSQVMAEEWRQQLGEHLPLATAAATKALGVTTAEFFKMMEAGELGLDFLVQWAAQLRRDVAGGVEGASDTAGAAFARLGNASRDLAIALGKDTMPVLKDLATALAELLKESTSTAEGLGSALAPVLREAGAAALGMASGVMILGKGLGTLMAFFSEGKGGFNAGIEDIRASIAKIDAIQERLLKPPVQVPKAPAAGAAAAEEQRAAAARQESQATALRKRFTDFETELTTTATAMSAWATPLEIAEKRLEMIEKFLRGLPATATSTGTALRSLAPPAIAAQLQRLAPQYGVDPVVAEGIMRQESSFNPNAQGSRGEVGLMQLMPAIIQKYGITNPKDPEQNIRGGLRLIRELQLAFPGDQAKVIMGYNTGQPNVERGTIPAVTRQQYLPAVQRNMAEIRGGGTPGAGSSDPFIREQIQSYSAEMRELRRQTGKDPEFNKAQREAEQERKKAERQAEADEKARVNRVLDYNSRMAEAEQKVAAQKLEMERKLDDEITKLALSERDLYVQRAESAGFAGDELDRLMAKYDDISQLKLDDKGLKFLQDLEAETSKLTLTEEERLKVQIEEMGLSADLTRQLLEQTQALKAARADKAAEKLRQDLVEETDKYKTPREQFLAEIDRMDLTPGKRGELLGAFEMKTAAKEWDEFRKKGLDVIEDLSEGLADFVMTGKLDFQSLANAAIAELLRISIKKTLTSLYESDTGQQALQWIGKVLQVGTQVTGAPGGAGGSGSPYMGEMPTRDSGGPVTAGKPYWIGGGKQPELFIPQSSGQVVPAAQVGRGQAAPVVHINIYAQDAPSVIRSRSEIARGMVQALQGAQRSA